MADRYNTGANYRSRNRGAFASMSITGIDEVRRMVEGLPEQVFNKSLPVALTDAAKVVVKAVRENAKKVGFPFGSGLTHKSIGTRRKNYKKSGVIFVAIGPRTGYKQTVTRPGSKAATIADPTKYWHLIEYGFVHKRSGRRIAPRPIFRSALEDHQAAVVQRIYTKLAKEIPKQAERLARKKGGK